MLAILNFSNAHNLPILQPNLESPCSNQEIHMLFEHGFKLENT